MPKNKPYIINKKTDKTAEILIYEQIGKDVWSDEGIGAKDFAEDLKALGDITEITLRINSPGGSVFDGLAIYNQLVQHKAAVIVYIDGIAASIASVIAMAGDTIYMPENALIMIHDPWSIAVGTADSMRKAAEALDKTKVALIAAYAKKTGKDNDEISKMMTDETWFTGAEAVEHKFADEMLESVKIAASFDLSKFKNMPQITQPAGKADNAAAPQGQETPKDTDAGSINNASSIAASSATKPNQKEKTKMKKCTKCNAEYADGAICQCEITAIRNTANKESAEILAIGEKHKCLDLAAKAIKDGKSKDDFVVQLLEQRYNAKAVDGDGRIGLNDKEVKAFSIVKAINALANPKDHQAQEAAAFEFEASRATAQKIRKESRGVFVPLDIIASKTLQIRNDMTTTGNSGADGGYLIATELRTASFIELLTNLMIVKQLGAQVLDGLVGNVAIPKQIGGATAYWIAENNAPTESPGTNILGQIGLTPKTVAAFTDISRKMIIQSSLSVENFIRMDLARTLAIAQDKAAISGSGESNQPSGILSTTGIGAVVGGENGAAPDWADIVDLWSEVAVDNAAFGSLAFLTNAKVCGKLMKTAKVSSTDSKMIIEKFPDATGFTELAGARCAISNQVPSTLTKGSANGVCSALIFGNFADLIIAQWGAIDILVDPYTGSSAGTVRVTSFLDTDIAVRHPESYSAMKDALTT